MTIADVFQQAQTLSPQDRKELVKLLVDSLTVSTTEESTAVHWGQALAQILDDMEPIELAYEDIDDPVDWVKQLRADQRQNRLGDDA